MVDDPDKPAGAEDGAFRNSRHTFFVQDEERAQRFVRAIEYLQTLAGPTDPFATETLGTGILATPPVAAAVPDVIPEPAPPPPPCYKYLYNSCEAQPYLNGVCQQAPEDDPSTVWILSAPVLADDVSDSDLSMRYHVEVLVQFGAVLSGTPSACFETLEDADADITALAEDVQAEGTEIMRVYLDQ